MNVNETPTVNVVLMQGRKSSGQVPLFLLPDGSGAAATYIYLPRFKSNLPVYALESPFLQCPAQFTCGIEGIAAKFAQAINKVRPGGPYLIGGYSAGAVMAYETARQLLEAGQTVQGLLLVDMCVPRPMPDLHSSLPTSSLELMVRLSPRTPRNFWLSEAGTKYAQEHMRRIISSLTTYDPKPMPVSARPPRTAIIWARRGLVETASEKTRKLLIQHKINIEPVNNFMEDPSLGPIAWSFPPGKSLGPNGWDRLVGDVKCIAIDGDHFSVIVPPDVSFASLVPCAEPYAD
jgi:zearalenone synthase (nonreducing iterative type I polyketide synthase)